MVWECIKWVEPVETPETLNSKVRKLEPKSGQMFRTFQNKCAIIVLAWLTKKPNPEIMNGGKLCRLRILQKINAQKNLYKENEKDE